MPLRSITSSCAWVSAEKPLHERHGRLDRGHIRPGSRRDERDEPQVVDVLVGQDHELDVLERVAEPLDPALELVVGGAGFGPVSTSVNGSSSIK